MEPTIIDVLLARLAKSGTPFFANDNVSSAFHSEEDIQRLQDEVAKRAEHFLRGLLIDVDNDHNTKGTAARIAKMYVREVFKGRYLPPPAITSFPNAKKLDEMYISGPITIRSACSHHFVPIIGKCWIGIIPSENVIGISKFNRIVDWVASRPQIQEELVIQIADFIEKEIQPVGLAVVVEATHMCMTWRGVKESMESKMTNSVMRGAFRTDGAARTEFLALVNR
jgi:GTP cyclohydrolase I